MSDLEFSSTKMDGWTLRTRTVPVSGQGPALIALHGFTGDEHSMDIFTASIPMDYLVIAPRGPFLGKTGYSWVFKRNTTGRPAYQDFAFAGDELTKRMTGWFNSVKFSPLSVSLIGFSQGAAFSLYLINEYPALFDRAAILSGFFPSGISPNPVTEKMARKELFVAHGTKDETIPVEMARTCVTLLERAGARVEYCEEEVGHKLGAGCFKGLKNFFLAPLGQGK